MTARSRCPALPAKQPPVCGGAPFCSCLTVREFSSLGLGLPARASRSQQLFLTFSLKEKVFHKISLPGMESGVLGMDKRLSFVQAIKIHHYISVSPEHEKEMHFPLLHSNCKHLKIKQWPVSTSSSSQLTFVPQEIPGMSKPVLSGSIKEILHGLRSSLSDPLLH